jgi:hypothetical protein
MRFNHPESVYYKSAVRWKDLISAELLAFKQAAINTRAKTEEGE